MLFVDNEQLSQEEFSDLFGIKLSEIRKRPSFEIDKSKKFKDVANGGVTKVNEGNAVRARFYAIHPKKNIKVEVVYAQSASQKEVGNTLKVVYEPRYVQYKGEKFSFKHDIDLALWMHLHPQNKFSPLRSPDSKAKSSFEFIDVAKRTASKLTSLTGLKKALSHAEELDDYSLVIMAKGLGFGGVDDKDIDELRVDLMSFATNPRTTQTYIDAMNNSVIRAKGKISNLIDNGFIKLTQTGQVRQWIITQGERADEPIGNQILNNSINAKESLVNYILSNMEIYNTLLDSQNESLQATIKAKEYFEQEEESNIPSYLTDDPNDIKNEVFDFNSAKAFVEKMGYPKTNGLVKQFENAVADGSVIREDASAFLKELYAK